MRILYVPSTVHPHACGEHIPRVFAKRLKIGSSPRLWGTFLGAGPTKWHTRFIPTPVGNIRDCRFEPNDPAVHPHACGEHVCVCTCSIFICGSSPRLWGTSGLGPSDEIVERFIPTPVGNISVSGPLFRVVPVHPHACGEHRMYHRLVSTPTGSSPRLWGTSSTVRVGLCRRRFIPTPVGNIKTSTSQ